MTATMMPIKKGRKRPTRRPVIGARWRNLFKLLPGYDPIATAGPGDWFDVAAAEEAIAFFPEMLTHIEGELAGKPFILEKWQQAIVGCIFGWKAADDYRRYREVFIFIGRKNGKTPLAAGIANYSLFCDHEIGAQNLCAAGEREQASLLFRHCKGMIEAEPYLIQRAKIYSGYGQRAIHYPAENSGFKVVSSEAGTKHGGNGHLAIIDELHVQPNRELVDVLETAMASANRRQPLLIHITTSDYERPSICNEKYDYAKAVCSGVVKDRAFLPVVYEADADDDWTDETVWRKANPNLGVSVSLDYLRRACEKAKNNPAFENTFKRLHLNLRTEQESRWLPMDAWLACGSNENPRAWREATLKRLARQQCFGGLDLGSTRDLTALVLLFGDENEGYDLLPWFWVPATGAERKTENVRALYDAWIRQGFVTATPGDVADYNVIRAEINVLANRYGIAELAVDRLFQGVHLCIDLAGDGLEVVPFGQGYYSMAGPCKRFEELLIQRKFRHGDNPVLNWMAGNVKVTQDTAGNMKPVKPERGSPLKIDGIVAAIMALGRAMEQPEQKASIYETRGPIV